MLCLYIFSIISTLNALTWLYFCKKFFFLTFFYFVNRPSALGQRVSPIGQENDSRNSGKSLNTQQQQQQQQQPVCEFAWES